MVAGQPGYWYIFVHKPRKKESGQVPPEVRSSKTSVGAGRSSRIPADAARSGRAELRSSSTSAEVRSSRAELRSSSTSAELRSSSTSAEARSSRIPAEARSSRISAEAHSSRITADARSSRSPTVAHSSRIPAEARSSRIPAEARSSRVPPEAIASQFRDMASAIEEEAGPPRQCCGSGSTGSTCFWASWIRIRIHLSEIWIRILLSLSKFSKKNLDLYSFVTSF
jgi:hypothetical protein